MLLLMMMMCLCGEGMRRMRRKELVVLVVADLARGCGNSRERSAAQRRAHTRLRAASQRARARPLFPEGWLRPRDASAVICAYDGLGRLQERPAAAIRRGTGCFFSKLSGGEGGGRRRSKKDALSFLWPLPPTLARGIPPSPNGCAHPAS